MKWWFVVIKDGVNTIVLKPGSADWPGARTGPGLKKIKEVKIWIDPPTWQDPLKNSVAICLFLFFLLKRHNKYSKVFEILEF